LSHFGIFVDETACAVLPFARSFLGSTEEIIMRAFAVCLTVCLGFGVFSAVACSSDATTGGSGAEAGEAPTAGKGGGASGGATGVGEGGAGGSTCAYDSDKCRTCLGTKCMTQAGACIGDDACGQALSVLEGCACNPSKTFDQCAMDFGQAGKVPAADLVTCFTDNCTADCM
jgi:hypothetical protein